MRLKGNACVEDVDYRTQRGIDKSTVRALAQESAWVSRHENIFIVGDRLWEELSGIGAGPQSVPRRLHGVLPPGDSLVPRPGDGASRGSLRNLLGRPTRMDVLVVDDWAMSPLNEAERRDFWEICEER